MSSKRAAIYCRISDDRSGRGAGVARQREDCLALAGERGWTVVLDEDDEDTFTDNDVSAYSGRRRPAYERLCQRVQDGAVDVIVAWHPDRLHRSPRELETFIDVLETARASVATVKSGDLDLSTSSGRMTARVVGAVARNASDQTRERVQRAMLDRAQAGQPHGRLRTYGLAGTRHPDGSHSWEVVEPEAEIIREVAQRLLAGENLTAITRDLHLRDVPTLSGKPWQRSSLRGIMVSARIAGWREHQPGRSNANVGGVYNGGEFVAEAQWPAIIDRATAEGVRRVLRVGDEQRFPARSRANVLAGLAFCGKCEAPLRSRPTSRGREVLCVKPPTGRGCGGVSMRAEPIITYLADLVRTSLDDGSFAQHLNRDASVDAGAAWRAVAHLETDMKALADDYGSGRLTRSEWMAARAPMLARLDAAQRDLRRVQGTGPGALLAGGLKAWDDAWADAADDVDKRRARLAQVFEAVHIDPAPRGSRARINLDRVRVTWRT